MYSFFSDFEDYFENIFNNLSTRRRQREIDLKSEDIFLNVNSICDEIIAKRVCTCAEEDFSKTPQMSRVWVFGSTASAKYVQCSKTGENTPKNFNQQNTNKKLF